MRTAELSVDTRGRLVTNLTERLRTFADQTAAGGLLNVFLPHATAGLALIETGAGSEGDLEEVVARLLPRDDRYAHRHGSTGHGGDHLLPAFVSPSLTLPVDAGRIVLGTWQSIVLVDPNRENNTRRIHLSLLEG